MKRLFNTLIICLILVTTDTLSVNARTFALIAGVSNYGVEDANLSQTTKDAKAFKQLLSKQTKDITLLTSTYANHDNILEKLRAICNRAQNGDRIIFYFSGHGNKGYLLTSDIKPLYYTEIANILNTTKASDVICFIDACFAGTLASGTTVQSTASLSNHDGHAYFVSCRPTETSKEAAWVGQGFFTQALLIGLRGKCDYDHNKEITVLELFKYIHADVTRRSLKGQHPQLIAPKGMHDKVIFDWKE